MVKNQAFTIRTIEAETGVAKQILQRMITKLVDFGLLSRQTSIIMGPGQPTDIFGFEGCSIQSIKTAREQHITRFTRTYNEANEKALSKSLINDEIRKDANRAFTRIFNKPGRDEYRGIKYVTTEEIDETVKLIKPSYSEQETTHALLRMLPDDWHVGSSANIREVENRGEMNIVK
jgi:predicted transcriptional regulator